MASKALVDVLIRDVEVRDGAEHRRVDRRREPDALLGEPNHRLLLRQRCDVELDEVRLGPVGVDREPGLGEAERQSLCTPVVVREPVDVVLERVDARGCDDPCLAHRAAEEVLEPARVPHHLGLPGQDGAERAAEAFRETERDRVEASADLSGVDPGRDGSIHQARAVEVEAQVQLECDCV